MMRAVEGVEIIGIISKQIKHVDVDLITHIFVYSVHSMKSH